MYSQAVVSISLSDALQQSELNQNEASLLLQAVLKVNTAYLYAHAEQLLTDLQVKQFYSLCQRRLAGEPIAYILGEKEFYGLKFKITPAVLIPRPETELLIDLALERIPPDTTYHVLDLGTGSGIIAITLAKYRPLAKITAIDQSLEALIVAQENAAIHQVNIHFLQSDWYQALSEKTAKTSHGGYAIPNNESSGAPCLFPSLTLRAPSPRERGANGEIARRDFHSEEEKFDLIVTNPPYVAEEDPHLTQGDLRFEPKIALTDNANGLSGIRTIIAQAYKHIKPGKCLLFEHGHNQGRDSRRLLSEAGFTQIETWQDLARIDRISGGIMQI